MEDIFVATIETAGDKVRSEEVTSEEMICPNCGSSITGTYCSICGQERRQSIVSVGEFIREVAGEFLAFDSRALRTIPLLTLRPGKLSSLYLEGKRQAYLSPIRLYLGLAFIAFF